MASLASSRPPCGRPPNPTPTHPPTPNSPLPPHHTHHYPLPCAHPSLVFPTVPRLHYAQRKRIARRRRAARRKSCRVGPCQQLPDASEPGPLPWRDALRPQPSPVQRSSLLNGCLIGAAVRDLDICAGSASRATSDLLSLVVSGSCGAPAARSRRVGWACRAPSLRHCGRWCADSTAHSCALPAHMCRRKDDDEPDPEQMRKDMERLALIRKKRWVGGGCLLGACVDCGCVLGAGGAAGRLCQQAEGRRLQAGCKLGIEQAGEGSGAEVGNSAARKDQLKGCEVQRHPNVLHAGGGLSCSTVTLLVEGQCGDCASGAGRTSVLPDPARSWPCTLGRSASPSAVAAGRRSG